MKFWKRQPKPPFLEPEEIMSWSDLFSQQEWIDYRVALRRAHQYFTQPDQRRRWDSADLMLECLGMAWEGMAGLMPNSDTVPSSMHAGLSRLERHVEILSAFCPWGARFESLAEDRQGKIRELVAREADWAERFASSAGEDDGIEDPWHPCPCCRYVTLGRKGGYDVCPVCFWEDDGQDDPHADERWGGPNGELSLTDARKNFRSIGAIEERHRVDVRPPLPWEIPAPADGGYDDSGPGDLFVAVTATAVTPEILELDFWNGHDDSRATTVYLPDDNGDHVETVSVHLRLSYDLRSLRGLDMHSVGEPTPSIPARPDVDREELSPLTTFDLRLPVSIGADDLVIDLRAVTETELVVAAEWCQQEPHSDDDDGFEIRDADVSAYRVLVGNDGDIVAVRVPKGAVPLSSGTP